MPTPTTANATVPTTNPVGPCAQPILLRATQLDAATGEVRTFDVQRRCGSRLAGRCASCSALYVGDAKAVIRSGLVGENGEVKETTLVTLTAPGAATFGATHRAGRNKRGKRTGRCTCGHWHSASDPLVSTPLDPETYDYRGAAAFNAAAGRLATVTFQKLSRILGRQVQVMRVVEYQRRGLLHIHALVLGEVSSADLALAVSGGINPRTGRRIRATSHDGWTWGPRCDARKLRLGDGEAGEAMARTVGYVTKVIGYVTKAAGDSARGNGEHGDRMAQAGEHSCRCEHPRPDCRRGRWFHGEGEAVQPWQSRPATWACRRHHAAHRGWGFRGHVLTVSRGWGTTFAAVRAARAGYVQAQSGALPPQDLVTTWTVLGRAGRPAVQGRRRRPLDDVKQFVTPDQARPEPIGQQMRAVAGDTRTVSEHEQF